MARNRKANLVGTISATSINVESIILVSGQDVSGQANNAYAQANAAYSQANSGYSQANAAYTQANSAYGQANASYSLANSAYSQANTATTNAQNAYDQANNAYGQANSGYTQANSAYSQANSAYTQANNAYNQANSGYTQANSAYTQANNAYNQANSSYTQANSAYGQANSAYGQANSAYDAANTAQTTAQNAYGQANTATTNAGNAYNQANAAYLQANNAYTAANNSNLTSGGLISGSLNVTNDLIVGGNIYLQGNTTYINVATYQVNDPLMYIAANNILTDTVDIGFVGAKNTSGVFSHTGLARDATDGKYKLFDFLPDSGHVGNVIDFANTRFATLVANVEANNITIGGNLVSTQANLTLAHDQANSAYTQANNAYSQANSVYTQANSAYGAANNRVLKAGDTMTGQLNISSGGLLVTDNVGIGTANPSYPFQITTNQNAATYGVVTNSDAGIAALASFGAYNGTAWMRMEMEGTLYSGTGMRQANAGVLAADGSAANGLSIAAVASAPIRFYTAGNAAGNERMRIDSSGRVLIGTAAVSISSSEKFEVYGGMSAFDISNDSVASVYIKNRSTTANTLQPYLYFNDGGANRAGFAVRYTDATYHQFSQGGITLYTGSAGFSGERVTITSAGNVGIGTTSPLNARLQISGVTTGPDLSTTSVANATAVLSNSDPDYGMYFATYGSGKGAIQQRRGASAVYYDLSLQPHGGNLGIGTTSPGQKLDVAARVRFRSDGTASAGHWLTDSSGTENVFTGLQGAAATSNWGVWTNSAWRMTITNTDGNVGIGTTSPAVKLDVVGGNTAEGQVRIYNTDVTYSSGINFYTSTTDRGFVGWRYTNSTSPFNAAGMYIINRDNSNIIFGTHNLERVRIDTNGNVGIGTTSPARGLHVATGNYIRMDGSGESTLELKLGANTVYLGHGGWGIGGNKFGIGDGSSPTILVDVSSDNVGIGTTSPGQILDIVGAGSSNTWARILGGAGTTSGGLIVGNNDTAKEYGRFFWNNATNDLIISQEYTSGSLVLRTNTTEKMRITSGGNVCIGTTASISPYAHLHIRGAQKGVAIQNSDSGYYRAIYVSSNNLYFYNGTNEGYLNDSGAWTNASDIRIKKDITEIKYGLNTVLATQPRSYKMRSNDAERIGFVAQEMLEVIPEVVSGDTDPERNLGIDYGSLVAVAFKAIQELKAELDAAKLRIAELENK